MSPEMLELVKVVGAPSVLLIILGFGWFRYAQHQNKQIFELFSNHIHEMGEGIKSSIEQVGAEYRRSVQEQQDAIQRNTDELRFLREKIGEMVVELRHLNGKERK